MWDRGRAPHSQQPGTMSSRKIHSAGNKSLLSWNAASPASYRGWLYLERWSERPGEIWFSINVTLIRGHTVLLVTASLFLWSPACYKEQLHPPPWKTISNLSSQQVNGRLMEVSVFPNVGFVGNEVQHEGHNCVTIYTVHSILLPEPGRLWTQWLPFHLSFSNVLISRRLDLLIYRPFLQKL